MEVLKPLKVQNITKEGMKMEGPPRPPAPKFALDYTAK